MMTPFDAQGKVSWKQLDVAGICKLLWIVYEPSKTMEDFRIKAEDILNLSGVKVDQLDSWNTGDFMPKMNEDQYNFYYNDDTHYCQSCSNESFIEMISVIDTEYYFTKAMTQYLLWNGIKQS